MTISVTQLVEEPLTSTDLIAKVELSLICCIKEFTFATYMVAFPGGLRRNHMFIVPNLSLSEHESSVRDDCFC